MSSRPSYKTFVVERPVDAPRAVVWRELLALLEGAGYRHEGDPAPHGAGAQIAVRLGEAFDVVEETLSFEPPWRRSYQMVAGAPVTLYQGTTTIRDDGPRCLLVWSYLVDQGDDPDAESFLAIAQQALRNATERIAVAAEAAAGATT